MRRLLLLFLGVICFASNVSFVCAEQTSKRGTVISESKVEDQAIVRDIDYKKRTLTVTMPNGALKTFVIDKSVKRFDHIKPNDVIKTTYTEAVTVKLRKVKIKPEVKVEESTSKDPEKIKPTIIRKRQVTMVASIEAISDDFKSVSLKGPDGEVEQVQVRNPSNLKMLKNGEVKVGDQVDITYSQALVIAVEKVEVEKKP